MNTVAEPPPFVAEIEVDLSSGVDEVTVARLRDLFVDHRVLVIHSPVLESDSQVAVMAAVGRVLPGERAESPVHLISNDPSRGTLGDRELLFHCDMSFSQEPYTQLSLYALDVIDGASSTVFADAVGAVERMPAALRARLERAEILNAFELESVREALRRDPCDPEGMWDRFPAIRRHPGTGRPLLWANQLQTVRIEGADSAESSLLLAQAFEVIYDPAHLYEHRWRQGDLVVWDNIGSQHARGNLAGVGTRTLRRVANGSRTFHQQYADRRDGAAAHHAFTPQK